jgi:Skp family chaperone for outer membrane proteins
MTTNKQNKSKEKQTRQKKHDLGKLSTALQAATKSIADAAKIAVDQVDLNRLNVAYAKASADLSAAIGVPPGKLKLSVTFIGEAEGERPTV